MFFLLSLLALLFNAVSADCGHVAKDINRLEFHNMHWSDGRGSNPVLYTANNVSISSKKFQSKDAVYVSLGLSARMGRWDAFLALWKTANSTRILYKEVGPVNLTVHRVNVKIPEDSCGRLVYLFNRKVLDLDRYVQIEYSNQLKTSKPQQQNFESNSTLFCTHSSCEWKNRQDGRSLHFENTSLNLSTGSQIESPRVDAGTYCVELDLLGKGRLDFYVLNGEKLEFRGGFVIDVDKFRSRRFVLVNVPKNSRILVGIKGAINVADNAEIRLERIERMNICEYRNTGKVGHFAWTIPSNTVLYGRDDIAILQHDTPLTTAVPIPGSKYFCFHYNFLTPPSLNIHCLRLKFGKDVVWIQCSKLAAMKVENCVQLPQSAHPVTAYLQAHPSIHAKSDHKIENAVLISSANIRESFDCDVTKLRCGWYQPNINSVVWSYQGVEEHYEKSRFTFQTHAFHNNYELIDYVYSPRFKIDTSDRYSCVSFKISTDTVVNLGVMANKVKIKNKFIYPSGSQEVNAYFENVQHAGSHTIAIGVQPLSEEASGYIEDLRIFPCGKSLPKTSVNCSFENDHSCGWTLSRRYHFNDIKGFYEDLTKNELIPGFDARFSASEGYLTLYARSTGSDVKETSAVSAPILTFGRACAGFSYYMNGGQEHDVTLHLILRSTKKVLWYVEGSQGFSWYRVQFPLELDLVGETLMFQVEAKEAGKTSTGFVAAIDEVYVTGSDEKCDAFHERVGEGTEVFDFGILID